jgi:hypothetical protein
MYTALKAIGFYHCLELCILLLPFEEAQGQAVAQYQTCQFNPKPSQPSLQLTDTMIYDKTFLGMEIIAVICLSLAVALSVFAVSLRAQAVIMLNQTRAAVIQNQASLAEKFARYAYCLFGAGSICILIGLLPLLRSRLPADTYWIPGGITLFAVAGTLLVRSKKLTTKDKREFGQKMYDISRVLVIAVGVLLIAGIILQLLAVYT